MTDTDRSPYLARVKSFTRRSRELSGNLQRTMDRNGGRFVVQVPRGDSPTTIAPGFRFDPLETFGRGAPLIVEIGSGSGEQIVSAAHANPGVNYLALEVWQPGIAKIVSRAADANIDNLRIIEADAAQALPIVLGDASVRELWTFFPDPWRKARHRKRRLVSDSFALQAVRLLEDSGIWRLATDWDDYAWQMRDVIESAPALRNLHGGERPDPADPEPERGGFAPRFDGRVLTRFERRGIEAGRTVHDLTAVRQPRS